MWFECFTYKRRLVRSFSTIKTTDGWRQSKLSYSAHDHSKLFLQLTFNNRREHRSKRNPFLFQSFIIYRPHCNCIQLHVATSVIYGVCRVTRMLLYNYYYEPFTMSVQCHHDTTDRICHFRQFRPKRYKIQFRPKRYKIQFRLVSNNFCKNDGKCRRDWATCVLLTYTTTVAKKLFSISTQSDISAALTGSRCQSHATEFPFVFTQQRLSIQFALHDRTL